MQRENTFYSYFCFVILIKQPAQKGKEVYCFLKYISCCFKKKFFFLECLTVTFRCHGKFKADHLIIVVFYLQLT